MLLLILLRHHAIIITSRLIDFIDIIYAATARRRPRRAAPIRPPSADIKRFF